MLKYELEVIVSFIELVPEEEIGLFEVDVNRDLDMTEVQTHLRKFEFLQSELLHDVITEHVGSSEEPASTTTLLVCNGARLEIDDIVEDMLVSNSCRARGQCRPNIRMRQKSSSELDLGVACCSSLPRGYMIQCQLTAAGERHSNPER